MTRVYLLKLIEFIFALPILKIVYQKYFARKKAKNISLKKKEVLSC